MNTTNLQIRLTTAELSTLREAAKRAELSMSDFARKTLLSAVRRELKPGDAATLEEVRNFRRLFIEAMDLNLAGKLTSAKLKGLAEKRSFA